MIYPFKKEYGWPYNFTVATYYVVSGFGLFSAANTLSYLLTDKPVTEHLHLRPLTDPSFQGWKMSLATTLVIAVSMFQGKRVLDKGKKTLDDLKRTRENKSLEERL